MDRMKLAALALGQAQETLEALAMDASERGTARETDALDTIWTDLRKLRQSWEDDNGLNEEEDTMLSITMRDLASWDLFSFDDCDLAESPVIIARYPGSTGIRQWTDRIGGSCIHADDLREDDSGRMILTTMDDAPFVRVESIEAMIREHEDDEDAVFFVYEQGQDTYWASRIVPADDSEEEDN